MALCSTVSLNRHHRGRAHAEGPVRIAVLEKDSDRKALREPHPVERWLDGGETVNASAVLLIQRPPDALHAAAKAMAGIGEEKHVDGHSRLDVRQEVLAEVRHHVPRAVVDETEHLPPLVGVLPNGNVEIGNIAVKGGTHRAIVDVELRLRDRGLGGFEARIDVAELAELALRP